MANIIDELSPDEALTILRLLAKSNKTLQKRIEEIAEKSIRSIDIEGTSMEVYAALDFLDIENVWDQSGAKSYGYVSPEDKAVEVIEEELEPFYQEVFRFSKLEMHEEAKLYCMGVLKGIYRYDQESKAEFKDWVQDVPGECFSYLLREWEKRNSYKTASQEMHSFIERECSEWAQWIQSIKKLYQ